MPILGRVGQARPRAACTALMLVLAAILLAIPGAAVAAPTASFTISPASPQQGQLVTYTSTGACDVAPCTNRWYHPEEFATGVAQPRKVASFTYTGTPGIRTVQLTIRNANGASSSVTRSFTLRAGTADTTSPNTTITSAPSNPTTSTDASMVFNSSETGSTFACSRDSSAYAACTDPKTYSGLAMGAHTFSVRAADASGNVDATPATWNWTVNQAQADTTAPDTTITSAPTDSTSTSASVSFTGTDNVGVAGFDCRIDGGTYASCASPKSYTALSVGSHTVDVRSKDAAGNVDATAASATWAVLASADTTAPTTTITAAPSNGTSTSASVSFTGADNVGVSRFECRVDAAAYATCVSPKAYSSLAIGSHTVNVRAYDAAGNVDATPAAASWTISGAQTGNNCMAVPSACGYPDTTNTGTLPGITRTAVSGNVTLSTPNQVYENKTVSGGITVTAANVTIRNVKVTSRGWAVRCRPQDGNCSNLSIQDTEIDLNGETGGYGIVCNSYTATRVFIHDGADGAYLCSNATVRDSFISLGPDTNSDGWADSTGFCSGPEHFDGLSSDGGAGYVIDHNTIRNPCSQTSAILMSTNSGGISNVQITNNLLAGGGYTLYCAATSSGLGGTNNISGNRIAKTYRPQGGYYGPVAYCSTPGVNFHGNVWDETGAAISG
jgi:hypothetical protein